MVEHDAKALYEAGENKLGTDEKTFIRIFSERSRAHLAAVSATYHNIYDRKLEKVNFFMKRCLLCIVMAAVSLKNLLTICENCRR